MKGVGGVVFGGPRTVVSPVVIFRHRRPTIRCYSSSTDHVSFIKDVAAMEPPQHLNNLLKVLQARGESLISPGAKQGMIPLAIPLSKSSSASKEEGLREAIKVLARAVETDPRSGSSYGSVTALLRWPTAPAGMEMPVVEVRKYGVWLLAKSVDQYAHRILVEEDVNHSSAGNDDIFTASADAAQIWYKKGDFASSGISSLDVYLLKKVGLFPDILERKTIQHFKKGDQVSALVTGEFYTKKEHFPGFGRPFVFNAEVLLKVGRNVEAKDAARGALKSPWWTLGCEYQEVAAIAQWEDEQIEFIKEKVSEEGKQEDLKKGKDPTQIALDEAAFLLDLASVEGTWDESVERIADCYKIAGLEEISKFISYRD